MERERQLTQLSEVPSPHQLALDEAIERANAYPNARGFLILDIDDVIFDTRPGINAELAQILHEHNPDAPTPTDADARIGLRKSYEHLFDPDDPGVFAAINKQVSAKPSIYTDAPLMHEKLVAVIQQLANAGIIPLLCLSARNEEIMELSREELAKVGLDLPVYAKFPEDDDIADMKTGVIVEIAERLPGKKIFMIDDQEDLIKKLAALQNPNIIGILYDTPRYDTPGETWDTVFEAIERLLEEELELPEDS